MDDFLVEALWVLAGAHAGTVADGTYFLPVSEGAGARAVSRSVRLGAP